MRKSHHHRSHQCWVYQLVEKHTHKRSLVDTLSDIQTLPDSRIGKLVYRTSPEYSSHLYVYWDCMQIEFTCF